MIKKELKELPTKAELLWQCRRGMLELDILLTPFCNLHYDNLSDSEKQNFVELLSMSDQALYDLFLGQPQTEFGHLKSIVHFIKTKTRL